jgi:hypothetical protein
MVQQGTKKRRMPEEDFRRNRIKSRRWQGRGVEQLSVNPCKHL